MENPTTLLVAIMFVTIIGIGIGNVLMALSDIVGGLRHPSPDRIHISWIILMLAAYLALFWETRAILDIADWLYAQYLYILAGPILMLFAANLAISPQPNGSDREPRAHYLEISRRLFVMLALLQVWMLLLDVVYQSLTLVSVFDALKLVLFIGLSSIQNYRLHAIGAALGWLVYLLPMALQGFLLIG